MVSRDAPLCSVTSPIPCFFSCSSSHCPPYFHRASRKQEAPPDLLHIPSTRIRSRAEPKLLVNSDPGVDSTQFRASTRIRTVGPGPGVVKAPMAPTSLPSSSPMPSLPSPPPRPHSPPPPTGGAWEAGAGARPRLHLTPHPTGPGSAR